MSTNDSNSNNSISSLNSLSSERDKFRLDFSNICGLKSNLNSVFAHLQLARPDILALSETQVFSDLDLNQYDFPGYSFQPAFFPHRGVGIYIKNTLICSRLTTFEQRSNAKFAFIWLKLKVVNRDIYFCFLYRSSELNSDQTWVELDHLSSTIDSIYSSSPQAEVIIAGDFNVHNDQWLPFSHTRDLPGIYLELFSSLNLLTQIVDQPTYNPRAAGQLTSLLDLFLTTDPFKYDVKVNAPLGNSDHSLISISYRSSALLNSSNNRKLVWHFKRARWDDLNLFFSNYDWSHCFHHDVDSACTLITNKILSGMNRFIPHNFIKIRNSPETWFTNRSKQAIKAKNAAFLAFKRNPSDSSKSLFVSARNTCSSIIAHDKHLFDLKIKAKILSSPKNDRHFWSLVKSVKSNFVKSSIPPLVDTAGIIIDPRLKANLLAKKFSSNSKLDNTIQPVPNIPNTGTSMKNIYFRDRAVLKVLLSLDIHKSAGPDGIPPIVLKNCARSLVEPLRRLFYKSYSSATFPSLWKIANVCPIPKKGGSSSDPNNYRPIAITSILSKVMEKVINHKFLAYLEKYHLLSDRQYGFRSNRSTGDLMTLLTENVSRAIHNFGECQTISLDIAKAFDKVWHRGLLAKLLAFGTGFTFHNWVSSFLSSRSIRVVLDGVQSDSFPIEAGVPQGSVLSSALFLIYINDLLTVTVNPIHSFADDSTLHSVYELPQNHKRSDVLSKRVRMVDSINRDLDIISAWGKDNLVSFNANKTQACLFSNKRNISVPSISFENVTLSQTSHLNLLGITLGSDLIWQDHILSSAKKAACRLGFLRRSKKYFNSENIILMYKSFIRPILEYNSHIWAGAPSSSKIIVDRIQTRAFRIVSNDSLCTTVDSLEHRRNVGALGLFYRYFNKDCSSELCNIIPAVATFNVTTRLASNAHPYTIVSNFSRTNKSRNSFISRSSRLWNRLPSEVFPVSYNLSKFKSNVNAYLRRDPLRISPGQLYPNV